MVLLTPGTDVSRSMHQASGAMTESVRSLRLMIRWLSGIDMTQVHLGRAGVVVVERPLRALCELGCLVFEPSTGQICQQLRVTRHRRAVDPDL